MGLPVLPLGKISGLASRHRLTIRWGNCRSDLSWVLPVAADLAARLASKAMNLLDQDWTERLKGLLDLDGGPPKWKLECEVQFSA